MSLLPSYQITFATDQPRDCAHVWSDQCLAVMRLGTGRVVTVTVENAQDDPEFELVDREDTYLTLFATAIAWTLLLPITLIGVVLSMLSSTQSKLYEAYQRSLAPDSDSDSSIGSDWERRRLLGSTFASPRLSARPSRAPSLFEELFTEANIPQILQEKEENDIFPYFEAAIRKRDLFEALLHRCVIYALRDEFGKQDIFNGVLDRVANELQGCGWLWSTQPLTGLSLSALCTRYYLSCSYRGNLEQDAKRKLRQTLVLQQVNQKYNDYGAQDILAEDLPLLLHTLWYSGSIDWIEKPQLNTDDLTPFIQKTGLDTDNTEKWVAFFQAICLVGSVLIAKQGLQAAADYFQCLEREPAEESAPFEKLQFSEAQKQVLADLFFPIGNDKKDLRDAITSVATTLGIELQWFEN